MGISIDFMELLKRCYKEGKHAFQDGGTMFDNPYNEYKKAEWPKANQWVIGYMEVEIEHEKT